MKSKSWTIISNIRIRNNYRIVKRKRNHRSNLSGKPIHRKDRLQSPIDDIEQLLKIIDELQREQINTYPKKLGLYGQEEGLRGTH